ncbi:MAG: DUF2752 domain-containing protein [Clostridia bacterium]|nr:DUF2752 domain-containing protein [Clostridia bacterium]
MIPKNFALKTVIAVLTAALAMAVYKIGISCVFLKLTGIPCPSCGITRATAALLSGRFGDALRLYPAYGALPMLFLYFIYDGEVFSSKWINRAVLALCFAAVIIFYIIKLINFL